ncbi:MAG: serine/threonine-protein kinase, partial [Thermoanaerobaculia bacterium]|nr:serine/threonine-protein kinase [Thermoanaerobaculia bacterium]
RAPGDLPDTIPETPGKGERSSGQASGEKGPPGPAGDLPAGAPRWIGPYRILELLGEGGMGSVYLAEQSRPIRRRVAIKLIQSRLPTREAVFRFEAERRSLARMSHPNIAQVFEAGSTDEGQPYLVMEHVPGKPLTRYCDLEGLSVAQRLDLFLEVCQGVHHAHQKGVLHRDLKPSNVLVTEVEERPIPKLIDFGIAKALDESEGADEPLTRAGRIVGTPAYLSPEAVLAPEGSDVDVRSDVYALGVLLFELLVGEVPFQRSTDNLATLIDRVRSEEPTPPSRGFASLDPVVARARAGSRASSPASLQRRLRGDLDWIVVKALAKERDRRFASAASLAADIRRYRRSEPVTARPPSRWYLASRFVQRHKIQVVAAALVLLTLVGGLVARTREARRANREAARATAAAERAEREAAAAREVSEFLQALFELSDPVASRGNEVTARELLDRGADRIDEELADQPATRARLREVMGGVYRSLGLYDVSGELLEESVAELEALGSGHELALADALESLGLHHYETGHYDETRALYDRVLRIRRERLGETHPETATILAHLGDLHEVQGEYEEAAPLFRQALRIRERILPRDHRDRAENLERLGIVLTRLDRRADGEAMMRESLEIRRRILGPDHPRVALTLNNLAIARAEGGDLETGRRLFLDSLEIRRRALPPDHPDVGQSLYNLGLLHSMKNELEEAERYWRRAGEIWRSSLDESHPRLLRLRTELAGLARRQGRHREAELAFRTVLERQEEILGPDSVEVSSTLEDLAGLLRERGALDEAAALYRRCLEGRRSRLPADDERVVRTRESLRKVLLELGREKEAAALPETPAATP